MLYVNFLEPHPPYFGPLNELLSEEQAQLPLNHPGTPIEREPEWYSKLRKSQQLGVEGKILWHAPAGLSHEQKIYADFQRVNRNYAGNCALVDRALSKILWMLEVTGQADNTIIVFTSDHGEMGGSHSLLQKSVMYEEAMHIPMLMRIPFCQSSQITVRQPVSQIDIVPTLLELLGEKPGEDLPGESWVGLLDGVKRRDDHVYVEWNDTEGGPNARTVISPDGYKLAAYDRDNSMLFDRNRDPLEMTNLCYRPESAPRVSRLRKRIEQWQRSVGDKLALPDKAT
jgi:arylsulfatase A-like enzyme